MTRLAGDSLTLAYPGTGTVMQQLSIAIPDEAVTAIVGPNGCGKSTLLRALARLMAPKEGAVMLDGQAIHRLPTIEVARQLCLLPQQPSAPDAITVEDLALRGRYPHQSFLQPPSERDMAAVNWALTLTSMVEFRNRPVDELSGGQRQRAWIAMALAQETPLLLLDEPTTYLDIAHQQEVLQLIQRLNHENGCTIVVVLHDINNAAQVCDHVIAMRQGEIVAKGDPQSVLVPEMLENVFGIACDVVTHPLRGIPIAVPRSRVLRGQSPPVSDEDSPALDAHDLELAYNATSVVSDVSLRIPCDKVTAIVGPNGCGKSTLLRALARLLRPRSGSIHLNDRPITHGSHRDFARQVAMLSQGAIAPAGVLVEDLVAVGRYPYQRWYRPWSRADQAAVDQALHATGVEDFRWRPVDTLSGGQRQRVWLAMTLAQETGILMLDEPTTFLDIAHQVEVLDLVWQMNRREGRTVLLVLHDLSQACRYADYLVTIKDGRVVAAGTPDEIVTCELVRSVFGVEACVVPDPVTGSPLILAGHTRSKAAVSV